MLSSRAASVLLPPVFASACSINCRSTSSSERPSSGNTNSNGRAPVATAGPPDPLAGVAHAVLFPSVIAEGSTAFPERYRGLGTTLMLAMFDAGNLVGAPLVGGTVHFAREFSLPAYPTMILVVTCILFLVTAVYARAKER